MSILNSLAVTESGGNFGAQNSEVGSSGRAGHYGRLQFGRDRLDDAMRAGVIPQGTTPEQFMADPDMQARTETWHKQDMMRQADRLGLTQYIGQEVGGIPITMDAILAMGHLGGMGGARDFLQSGGRDNPADSFGTSLADYARRHGGATTQATPRPNALTPEEPSTQGSDNRRNALAMIQRARPQINALSADAFQSRANTAPQYGFGSGQNPFVR